MENKEPKTKPDGAASELSAELAVPVAFIDEHGRIVIIGFDAWNKALFVDADRAFPDSWKRLVPVTSNEKIDGRD